MLIALAAVALAVSLGSPDGATAPSGDSALGVESARQAARHVDAAMAAQGIATIPGGTRPSIDGNRTLVFGATETADAVSMTLPLTGPASHIGSRAVFAGDAADTRVIVQQAGPEAQTFVQLTSAHAPTRYEFRFGGGARTLERNRAGGVEILGAHNTTLGTIPPPWARDARGQTVPTRYEVEGLRLTQVVAHRDRALVYPVTADPAVVTRNGPGWRFSRNQSRTLMRYALTGSGGVAGLLICGWTAPAPPVTAVCGAIAGKIVNDISDGTIKKAYVLGLCIEAGPSWVPGGGIWTKFVRCH
jgi:hypothetical protein